MDVVKKTYDSSATLTGTDLTCRRGGRIVFEGLGFEAQAGDFVCLRGSNGSGKSTLLRSLCGFLPQASGQVSWLAGNEKNDHLPADTFLQSGHQNGLKPNFSLKENATFFVSLMTGRALSDAELQAAAAVFDLQHLLDDPVQYFSSGQRHRAALMRFALVERQVWLMDEPTVGLDAANRSALGQLITNHSARGGIVIAATHDPLGVEGKELNMDDFQPKTSVVDEAWL